jgi:glycine cleavage system transcriptional repressor
MRTNVVLTLTGPDRIGLVEEITLLLLERGGNVEASRMARLGGEFAMLMLVSLPGDQIPRLDGDIGGLVSRGYAVTVSRTGEVADGAHPGWLPCTIAVHGADHEGIIHEVAGHLSARGVNIESMDTVTTRAPVSGTPLFGMTAVVAVPPGLTVPDLESSLAEVGRRLNVDIEVAGGEAS